MRKNKVLTIWAAIVFAFLMIPLLIITVTAFGGGSAITFPIERGTAGQDVAAIKINQQN